MNAPVYSVPVAPSADEWIMNAPYRLRVGGTWQYCATWPLALAWHEGVCAGGAPETRIELSPRHAAEHPVMVDPYDRPPRMPPTAGQIAMADSYGSSSGEQ